MTDSNKTADDFMKKLNIQYVKDLTDPRIENSPLPNDSTITKAYGGLSYITTTYPGYTWRNGHWYQISDKLSFAPTSEKSVIGVKTGNNINASKK